MVAAGGGEGREQTPGPVGRWRERQAKRWQRLQQWSRQRRYEVGQWWEEQWRQWVLGAQLLVGWGLVTWAAAEMAVWAAGLLGWTTGPIPAIVWKGSAGGLILGLVGRRMLGQLFDYGPILLDEMDQEDTRRRR